MISIDIIGSHTVTYTALFYQINMVRFLVPSASFVQADRMVILLTVSLLTSTPYSIPTEQYLVWVRIPPNQGMGFGEYAQFNALYTYYVDINPRPRCS